VTGSEEHELIVAMVARYVRKQGYEIVALESSLAWLFGVSFRLPPSIVKHRPDVLGVRQESPHICIGEAKTRNDLGSLRTKHQIQDFVNSLIGLARVPCDVVIGIPSDCKARLEKIVLSIGVDPQRLKVVAVPRPLLPAKKV
jgi:hypothetical protein